MPQDDVRRLPPLFRSQAGQSQRGGDCRIIQALLSFMSPLSFAHSRLHGAAGEAKARHPIHGRRQSRRQVQAVHATRADFVVDAGRRVGHQETDWFRLKQRSTGERVRGGLVHRQQPGSSWTWVRAGDIRLCMTRRRRSLPTAGRGRAAEQSQAVLTLLFSSSLHAQRGAHAPSRVS